MRDADLMDMHEYLSVFVPDLEAALGMTIKTACQSVMVPAAMVTQFAIIVSELAMNALKHAEPTSDQTCAVLEFGQNGDALLLSFRDNGAGLPEDFAQEETTAGMGLLIILRAVEQLGGTLTAQSTDGAVFTLKVPAPQIG